MIWRNELGYKCSGSPEGTLDLSSSRLCKCIQWTWLSSRWAARTDFLIMMLNVVGQVVLSAVWPFYSASAGASGQTHQKYTAVIQSWEYRHIVMMATSGIWTLESRVSISQSPFLRNNRKRKLLLSCATGGFSSGIWVAAGLFLH